eukprot:CAMPEP_0168173484 /NCGR_PEP_ID=MMETSP0139_2-20121125/5926_1 /TAXON_ID=44445 /ORGANISM="Pseudo-nitzschia australis, Strain 10249 10 AB" /LENGTH=180 /DNA_ID=CAMNT_0008091433 /DNA_START=901 /DNA_END=1444 /DNA_ORIENTATION=-
MIFQLMKQRMAVQLKNVNGADNSADEPLTEMRMKQTLVGQKANEPVKRKIKRRKETEWLMAPSAASLGDDKIDDLPAEESAIQVDETDKRIAGPEKGMQKKQPKKGMWKVEETSRRERRAPQLAIVDGADNRADEPVKGKMKRRKETELQSAPSAASLGDVIDNLPAEAAVRRDVRDGRK